VNTIVFATGNRNKINELEVLFRGVVRIKPLIETGINADFEETGSSFVENSIQKAIYYSQKLTFPVVADDSGLEIDALNGEPGIYSARYFSPEMPYSERCLRILEKMKMVATKRERSARFCCVATCAFKGKTIATAEGQVEGQIARDPAGNNGFGYDPIFYYPPFERTFAELTMEEKNQVSHRKAAFQKLAEQVLPWLQAL
jgi:XTP/dITP diphosphohydrolase